MAVTDFDVEDGSFFLVMDLIESVTLARQFRQAPDAANLRFCAEGKFDGIYLGSPSITT